MTQLPRLDFLADGRPSRWPGHALLATALAIVALTALDALEAQHELDDRQQGLARWTAESASRRAAQAGPRPAAAPGDSVAVDAAWRLMRARRHPWGDWFAGVEAATPSGVRWLAAEHDRERGDVRLDGLAPDPATALSVVTALDAHPGWSAAVVSRLAPSPDTTGGALRFEVHARFDGAPIRTPSAP